MKEFIKTKTYQNLKSAFAGECEAHMKYQYYASQAKKDGYVQIKNIFEETAHNEKEHAKIWFKLLHDGKILNTENNLDDSIKVEYYEAHEMYRDFANIAYEEGYDKIGDLFNGVADIEQSHYEKYNTLLKNIRKNNIFYKNGNVVKWKCTNCGHIHQDVEAPDECPICQHPRSFFEVID